MSEIQGNRGDTFEQWCDMIELSSYSPRPDPDWSHTDEHGHEHRWLNEGVPAIATLPTLRWELDPGEPEFWTDADGDEHNGDGAYHCIECGDVVEPGMRGPSPYKEFIPGLMHYSINGVEVSKAEFDARFAASPGEAK